MVAGGGASVIYADTVGDLGFASEVRERKREEGETRKKSREKRESLFIFSPIFSSSPLPK